MTGEDERQPDQVDAGTCSPYTRLPEKALTPRQDAHTSRKAVATGTSQ
jgi:hypothetical protein